MGPRYCPLMSLHLSLGLSVTSGVAEYVWWALDVSIKHWLLVRWTPYLLPFWPPYKISGKKDNLKQPKTINSTSSILLRNWAYHKFTRWRTCCRFLTLFSVVCREFPLQKIKHRLSWNIIWKPCLVGVAQVYFFFLIKIYSRISPTITATSVPHHQESLNMNHPYEATSLAHHRHGAHKSKFNLCIFYGYSCVLQVWIGHKLLTFIELKIIKSSA